MLFVFMKIKKCISVACVARWLSLYTKRVLSASTGRWHLPGFSDKSKYIHVFKHFKPTVFTPTIKKNQLKVTFTQ